MDLRYAYSQLIVKAVDDDARIIEGTATTPTPDVFEDVVEPRGASFKLPIPLLWQHNSGEPVGKVTDAKVTADGISIKAQFARDSEPGLLQAELHKRFRQVKTGLVGGLSIGFRAKEWQWLDNGGIHFTEWEWIELSLVTFPANVEATITAIKSAAQRERAAPGNSFPTNPGVSGPAKITLSW